MARHRKPESPLSRAMLGLEDADALDSGVRLVRPVMDGITANATVRDFLQGRWLGHALHPLLVMVPLGSWLSAIVLDLSGTDEGGEAAQLLTGLGVLTAAPSAATGWAELADAGPREKRVGVVHAAANGGAVALQIGSWLARRSDRQGVGRALALAAVTLASAGGFLGGHLSVARGVGSRDQVFEDLHAGRLL